MNLKKDEEGNYHVEFKTQYGTTGSVALETREESEALDRVRAMRVEELERVSQVVNLTHQTVGQIIAGRTLSVAEAIGAFEQHALARRTLSRNTVRTHVCILKSWARVVGIGNSPVVGISPDQVAEYINHGHERRTTALRKLSAIRSFYSFLFNEGLVLRNPAAKGMVRVNYDAFTHNEKELVEKSVFTDQEIEALLGTATPFWRAAIIIGRDTGLRLSDIVALEWASVNAHKQSNCVRDGDASGLDSCVDTPDHNRSRFGGTSGSQGADELPRISPCRLIVWTDKSNTRVNLEFTDAIHGALDQLPGTGIQYVFPDEREAYSDPKRRAGFSVTFGRMCRRCNIFGRSFHCLRHTYASRQHGVRGLTLREVADNLGHRNVSTTTGYIHTG